jgi:thiamine transport system substrate-binding protein
VKALGAVALALALLAAACAGGSTATSGTVPLVPTKISLLAHDSFLVSDEVMREFTTATGIEVEVLRGGDAGTMLNQAMLTAGNPLADVLFGVDNTFLSRAFDGDLFIPYQSPGLAGVPATLQVDPQHRVTPIDFGDVCLNYDKAAFSSQQPPRTLEDLTAEAYRGMLVVENPATSSPGLAFVLATIARFGEEGSYTWRDYWSDLRANDVLVAAGWEQAYYGAFSGGSGEGDRPIVVSYASSPPAEVIYAEQPPAEAPTAVMTDGCFRQIEFAGILRGSAHQAEAAALIDFMLSARFQEDIPLNMFMFPALSAARLPAEFTQFTSVPESPVLLDPATIGSNRERWVREWTETVLQ